MFAFGVLTMLITDDVYCSNINHGEQTALEELANLASEGDFRAIKLLKERLGHWDFSTRRVVCEALGKIGDAKAVEPLIDRLKDKDFSVRIAAYEALGQIGDNRAVPPLIDRLGDQKSFVRKAACEVLGKIGDNRAVKPLIERLGDKDSNVRQATCEALRKFGEGRLAEAVVGALEGYKAALEELACLASEGDLRAIKPLKESLEDKDSSVCQTTSRALNSIYQRVKPQLNEMMCNIHFTRFETREVNNGRVGKAHYVACRICGKAEQARFGVREIIALLDERMEEEFVCNDGIAKINWLTRDALFDFDRVEIVKASDDDVERFCLQVENDKDNFRNRGYRKMLCLVSPQCHLIENTMRILSLTFGEVFGGGEMRRG
jgi:HEAT repeat protein